MRWFVKTASAATLSLCLFGNAYGLPDGNNNGTAAAAKAQGSLESFSFRVASLGMNGGATVFSVDKDGNYTVTQDGGMAHFVVIKAQGKLTSAQQKALESAVDKTAAENPPANLPGIVPGSPEFTVSWSKGGVSGSTSGAMNTKGAIEDAKQQGKDVSAWKVVASLVSKVEKLETKVVADYKPTLPAPDKKPAFDEISIEERNSWTGGTDKLTVKADGTYTLERSFGQSTLTGTLSKAQLDAINTAYDSGVMKTDDGKMVGGLIPDDTMFTITSSEGGKTYKVNGSVDSQNLGPLAQLEHALVGDVSSLQPPVAHPIDKTATDDKTASADGVTAAIKNRGGAGDAAPRAGMSTILEERTSEAADKAGDKAGGK